MLCPSLILLSLGSAVKTSESCVPLNGIVDGGGDGAIDLGDVRVSLKDEPFALDNPVLLTVTGCSTGVETPIGMHIFLGESLLFGYCWVFYTWRAQQEKQQ